MIGYYCPTNENGSKVAETYEETAAKVGKKLQKKGLNALTTRPWRGECKKKDQADSFKNNLKYIKNYQINTSDYQIDCRKKKTLQPGSDIQSEIQESNHRYKTY